MNSQREFDLVLHGATGFTGQLASDELMRFAPSHLKWAISGRSANKIKVLAKKLGVPGLVADGLNQSDVDSLASKTRVVLSCAGPFSLYGSLLVEACVKHATHYADLTGELPWIHQLIEKHHQKCSEEGTTVIPASGFDSVPTDLAVQALVKELPSATNIYGFYTMKGGLNGGTLHSGLALADKGNFPRPHFPKVFHVPPLNRWAAPFLMAAVNESVVRRSAKSLATEQIGYQDSFHYQEYLMVGGRLQAHTMSALLKLSSAMLASPTGRWLLRRFGPKPGEGPSQKSIRTGFAHLVLMAGSLDQPIAIQRWDWSGDPSNQITVACLVQTGLALADGQALRGGVLTPASGLGASLLQRLKQSGAVRQVDWTPRN
jgi:short subunit dehydrogenase-like uncharacterized protein